ncbi:MAG: ATP-binding protein [Pseudomonadota bacterium]
MWFVRQDGADAPRAPVLNAIPNPVLIIDAGDCVTFANTAAEHFFGSGRSVLIGSPLALNVPANTPLYALIREARRSNAAYNEYDIVIDGPRTGERLVDATASPVWEEEGAVVLVLHERTMARTIDRQLTHRNAARALTGLAETLAHEIKNPLAGIRGAAQLLQDSVGEDDETLATLIRDEADRIRRLVDEMEAFGDTRVLEREPVNIHAVLERVKQVARSSFAAEVAIEEDYDPSLPPTVGDYDKLVQIFLNLVKNASDAVKDRDGPGRIRLTTAYRPGMRMRMGGVAGRSSLPLEVGVHDNGPGVAEDVFPNMYEPFVSDKSDGKGLGLALVAKLVGEHGGVIECENTGDGAAFRVLLPIAANEASPQWR